MAQKTPVIFAEVFPLKADVLPTLTAYRLDLRENANADYIGRRLVDRLGRMFAGHWVWTQGAILTDHHEPKSAINDAVRDLKGQEKDTFHDLKGITLLRGWKPDVGAQADFAAYGLLTDLKDEIEPALASMKYTMDGKATVEREWEVRGWNVGGQPAVSLSIDSYLMFKQDLREYAAKVDDPHDLIGLHVADKVLSSNGTAYRGEILDVVGKLDVDVPRSDLLALAKKEGSKAIIQEAPEGEWVVRVGYNEYDYVVSALRIVLYPQHYRRFGVQAKNAQNATWITPVQRATIIKKVADIAKRHGLVDSAYTSENSKQFFGAKQFQYDGTIRLGKKQTADYDNDHLFEQVAQAGLYRRNAKVGTSDKPLRLGIIKPSATPVEKFQGLLEEKLRQLNFTVGGIEVVGVPHMSRDALEEGLELMRPYKPHLLIGMLPGVDSRGEDDWGAYLDFKSLTMDGISTLAVDAKVSAKNVDHVALSLVSRLGNIPYVLATPLDYADQIVGLDIARQRGAHSDNDPAAAIAYAVGNDGRYLGCRVIASTLEGESVPASDLTGLFPADEYGGKTVLLHRNGAFRGDEKAILKAHAAEIGATFYFVEVMKQGAPRLYLQAGRGVEAPGLGTVFVINDAEAFLVSSQTTTATPNPLHIRAEAPLTIGKALHSVFSLTLPHYGTPRRPRLPVSLFFNDRIGYLALRGVTPRHGQSGEIYWL